MLAGQRWRSFVLPGQFGGETSAAVKIAGSAGRHDVALDQIAPSIDSEPCPTAFAGDYEVIEELDSHE